MLPHFLKDEATNSLESRDTFIQNSKTHNLNQETDRESSIDKRKAREKMKRNQKFILKVEGLK